MKTTRRAFAFLLMLFAAATALLLAQSADKPSATKNFLAFVGTYTTKTASKGIYAFRYDASSGKLSPIGVAAETPDPSWVAIHPNGRFLYAVNEAGKNSTVSAFALDAKTAKLTLLNQLSALGEDPCYISFDRTGKYVLVANYTSGNVVVFPIGADGKLGPATANVRDEGSLGPNKERQEAAHAHWVRESEHHIVFVADLGLDRLLFYDFDPVNGTLVRHRPVSNMDYTFIPSELQLPAGTGPRHVALAKRGEFHQYIYTLGELSSTIVLAGDWKDGFVDKWQTVPMLPAGFEGRNDAAELAIHSNGKFLYASNRGHDSIAVFRIDPATGKLTAAGDFSVQGKEPRHFAIDPSGNYLLAEDQLSDKIVTFRIDQQTGALTPTGHSADVPSPVCIAFVPVE